MIRFNTFNNPTTAPGNKPLLADSFERFQLYPLFILEIPSER